VCVKWSLDTGDTAAVPDLRHKIMACLVRFSDARSDLAGAEIVVGELLSNAVAHTRGPAWISLRWDGVHPLLSVADVGPGFAHLLRHPAVAAANQRDVRGLERLALELHGLDVHGLDLRGLDVRNLAARLPPDPLAVGGRGLYLVTRLALDVAVAPRSTGGTVVSVILDVTRAPGAPPGRLL
jgi:anti-sigma regulatory factor (Ser/Thr protein kinase)